MGCGASSDDSGGGGGGSAKPLSPENDRLLAVVMDQSIDAGGNGWSLEEKIKRVMNLSNNFDDEKGALDVLQLMPLYEQAILEGVRGRLEKLNEVLAHRGHLSNFFEREEGKPSDAPTRKVVSCIVQTSTSENLVNVLLSVFRRHRIKMALRAKTDCATAGAGRDESKEFRVKQHLITPRRKLFTQLLGPNYKQLGNGTAIRNTTGVVAISSNSGGHPEGGGVSIIGVPAGALLVALGRHLKEFAAPLNHPEDIGAFWDLCLEFGSCSPELVRELLGLPPEKVKKEKAPLKKKVAPGAQSIKSASHNKKKDNASNNNAGAGAGSSDAAELSASSDTASNQTTEEEGADLMAAVNGGSRGGAVVGVDISKGPLARYLARLEIGGGAAQAAAPEAKNDTGDAEADPAADLQPSQSASGIQKKLGVDIYLPPVDLSEKGPLSTSEDFSTLASILEGFFLHAKDPERLLLVKLFCGGPSVSPLGNRLVPAIVARPLVWYCSEVGKVGKMPQWDVQRKALLDWIRNQVYEPSTLEGAGNSTSELNSSRLSPWANPNLASAFLSRHLWGLKFYQDQLALIEEIGEHYNAAEALVARVIAQDAEKEEEQHSSGGGGRNGVEEEEAEIARRNRRRIEIASMRPPPAPIPLRFRWPRRTELCCHLTTPEQRKLKYGTLPDFLNLHSKVIQALNGKRPLLDQQQQTSKSSSSSSRKITAAVNDARSVPLPNLLSSPWTHPVDILLWCPWKGISDSALALSRGTVLPTWNYNDLLLGCLPATVAGSSEKQHGTSGGNYSGGSSSLNPASSNFWVCLKEPLVNLLDTQDLFNARIHSQLEKLRQHRLRTLAEVIHSDRSPHPSQVPVSLQTTHESVASVFHCAALLGNADFIVAYAAKHGMYLREEAPFHLLNNVNNTNPTGSTPQIRAMAKEMLCSVVENPNYNNNNSDENLNGGGGDGGGDSSSVNNSSSGWTPLQIAIICGEHDAAKVLLDLEYRYLDTEDERSNIIREDLIKALWGSTKVVGEPKPTPVVAPSPAMQKKRAAADKKSGGGGVDAASALATKPGWIPPVSFSEAHLMTFTRSIRVILELYQSVNRFDLFRICAKTAPESFQPKFPDTFLKFVEHSVPKDATADGMPTAIERDDGQYAQQLSGGINISAELLFSCKKARAPRCFHSVMRQSLAYLEVSDALTPMRQQYEAATTGKDAHAGGATQRSWQGPWFPKISQKAFNAVLENCTLDIIKILFCTTINLTTLPSIHANPALSQVLLRPTGPPITRIMWPNFVPNHGSSHPQSPFLLTLDFESFGSVTYTMARENPTPILEVVPRERKPRRYSDSDEDRADEEERKKMEEAEEEARRLAQRTPRPEEQDSVRFPSIHQLIRAEPTGTGRTHGGKVSTAKVLYEFKPILEEQQELAAATTPTASNGGGGSGSPGKYQQQQQGTTGEEDDDLATASSTISHPQAQHQKSVQILHRGVKMSNLGQGEGSAHLVGAPSKIHQVASATAISTKIQQHTTKVFLQRSGLLQAIRFMYALSASSKNAQYPAEVLAAQWNGNFVLGRLVDPVWPSSVKNELFTLLFLLPVGFTGKPTPEMTNGNTTISELQTLILSQLNGSSFTKETLMSQLAQMERAVLAFFDESYPSSSTHSHESRVIRIGAKQEEDGTTTCMEARFLCHEHHCGSPFFMRSGQEVDASFLIPHAALQQKPCGVLEGEEE